MANDIPRYVLSLTDTHTKVPGKDGEQYFNMNVAVDKLGDFTKPLKKAERSNAAKTELQRFMLFFQEAVEAIERGKK